MSEELEHKDPSWWNAHQGSSWDLQIMSVPGKHEMYLKSHVSRVKIVITHVGLGVATELEDAMLEWLVKWDIRNYSDRSDSSLNDRIIGQVLMAEDELVAAFCLGTLDFGRNDAASLPHFEAHQLRIGKFVRCGCCLNLPNPGTGKSGDPNVSLRLRDDVVEVMRNFVSAKPRSYLKLVVLNKEVRI